MQPILLRPENTAFDLFRLFEGTPDLFCIAGKDGYFKYFNQAVCETLGYSREELYAQPIFQFIHPDDRELTARKRAELLEGKALTDLENRYRTRSGAIVWLHWTSIYFADQEIVFAIAKDVTERKKKEEAIEENYRNLQSIASHFKFRLEKDKKHLARELHEELAQLATVVRMDLTWLREQNSNRELEERMERALLAQELLIHSIRRLSYTISPSMIDDLGLKETLQWLCEEFTQLNRIPCTFYCDVEEDILSHEVQVDLFRICQEALSNVMRHAAAGMVGVRLEYLNQRVQLSVRDDGKGFDVAAVSQALGLENMKKRAASIPGRLLVESEPGAGTCIRVEINVPFKA